jgi:hypothetical protein
MPVIGDSELLVIQQQVIRVVFGEFIDLSSLADAEVRMRFLNRYTEAVEAMEAEKNLYRTPYYTADPTWVRISTRIKGGQLRLKDLLLYDKPTEQTVEIFPKMVRNLTTLWHIFDLLPLDN